MERVTSNWDAGWEEEVSKQEMTEQISDKKAAQRVIPEHRPRSQGSKEGELWAAIALEH